MTCRERTTCRLCGSSELKLELKLPDTPLANEFTTEPVEAELFPLELRQCQACEHVQLGHVIDPERLFRNYTYTSGVSETFRKHFAEYARVVSAMLPPNPFVVEIGSNDGTLLREFQKHGASVLGFEPATELAKRSQYYGVPTTADFFGAHSACVAGHDIGLADAIVANNVMAHIDDLDDVMQGVAALLKPTGLFVFEVSYLLDMSAKYSSMWTSIYHEHLDYHHLRPLARFMRKHGFALYDAHRVSTHGGSVRCYVTRDETMSTRRLGELIALEHEDSNARWWWNRIDNEIAAGREILASYVKDRVREGKRVDGYGAPAKLTTAMYALGLTGEHIGVVADDSPLKQGRYTPGTNIPIVPVQQLYERRPDYVVLFAGNLADEMKRKHPDLGCEWITV